MKNLNTNNAIKLSEPASQADFLEYSEQLLVTLTNTALKLGLVELSYFLAMASAEASDASRDTRLFDENFQGPKKIYA